MGVCCGCDYHFWGVGRLNILDFKVWWRHFNKSLVFLQKRLRSWWHLLIYKMYLDSTTHRTGFNCHKFPRKNYGVKDKRKHPMIDIYADNYLSTLLSNLTIKFDFLCLNLIEIWRSKRSFLFSSKAANANALLKSLQKVELLLCFACATTLKSTQTLMTSLSTKLWWSQRQTMGSKA